MNFWLKAPQAGSHTLPLQQISFANNCRRQVHSVIQILRSQKTNIKLLLFFNFYSLRVKYKIIDFGRTLFRHTKDAFLWNIKNIFPSFHGKILSACILSHVVTQWNPLLGRILPHFSSHNGMLNTGQKNGVWKSPIMWSIDGLWKENSKVFKIHITDALSH